MTKKYILIIILGSSVLSAIILQALSFFQSSEVQAQTCVAIPPPLSLTYTSGIITSTDNNQWVTAALGNHKICTLSYVRAYHTDDDEAICSISRDAGGNWFVNAKENNDDDTQAQCQAMCFD